jgi:Methenyl tetrahydrofolate cyclohydrolase
MSFVKVSCEEFVDVLSSKAAVPGGGGASALAGAIGVALGSMVGNLTVGKKKYADVEDDIKAAMATADDIRAELLHLIDQDAVVFEPLSKAYGLPKDTPEQQAEKARIMEACLRDACSVPMDIMRTACRAIDLHVEFGAKGSALAISDVGVGVVCCKAALQGASLNVFINTKSMTDREYAAKIEAEANELLTKYCAIADKVYADVVARLR